VEFPERWRALPISRPARANFGGRIFQLNRLRGALCCVAMWGLLVLPRAGAQTVTYDNLVGSAGNPVQAFINISKLGQSFTAAGSGSISSVSLNLTAFNTGVSSYNVQLWSDSGGATPLPTALLATFVSNQSWTANYSGTPGTQNAAHVITFSSGSFGENYSVGAGTNYWLVVATNNTGAARAWGVSSTTLGPSAEFSTLTSTWATLPQAGSFGGQIAISAVPEPSTYAAIAGAVVLGWTAWRRARARLG
jgi:hypothetical protein